MYTAATSRRPPSRHLRMRPMQTATRSSQTFLRMRLTFTLPLIRTTLFTARAPSLRLSSTHTTRHTRFLPLPVLLPSRRRPPLRLRRLLPGHRERLSRQLQRRSQLALTALRPLATRFLRSMSTTPSTASRRPMTPRSPRRSSRLFGILSTRA